MPTKIRTYFIQTTDYPRGRNRVVGGRYGRGDLSLVNKVCTRFFAKTLHVYRFYPSRSICGIYGEIFLFAKILCTVNYTIIYKNLLNISEYLWYLRHSNSAWRTRRGREIRKTSYSRPRFENPAQSNSRRELG